MPTRFDELVLDSADPARTAHWWADALGWRAAAPDADGDVLLTPPDGAPGLPLLVQGVPADDLARGGTRLHLDLATTTRQEQEDVVARLEQAGARRLDVGQGDVPWVVLADPDGLPFCVLEPRQEYLRAGTLAAVVLQAVDPPSLARFWAAATGWGVTASEPGFASLRPVGRDAGPALELVAGPPPDGAKNRLHLDVAPVAGPGEQRAEVERLLALGATRAGVGQTGTESWVVLADPEGNALCVLSGDGPDPLS